MLASGDGYLLILQGEYKDPGSITMTVANEDDAQLVSRTEGIHYRDIETLQLWLSETEDTLTIESTHAGATNIYSNDGNDIFYIETTEGNLMVNAGAGDDLIRLGTQAAADSPEGAIHGIVNHLNGSIVIQGSEDALGGTDGIDTLIVGDQAETTNDTGALTLNTITGLGLAGVTYHQIDYLEIYTGSGDETFTVESTHVRETFIDTFDGRDQITVETTDGATSIHSGDDYDEITAGHDGIIGEIDGGLLSLDFGNPENIEIINQFAVPAMTNGQADELIVSLSNEFSPEDSRTYVISDTSAENHNSTDFAQALVDIINGNTPTSVTAIENNSLPVLANRSAVREGTTVKITYLANPGVSTNYIKTEEAVSYTHLTLPTIYSV